MISRKKYLRVNVCCLTIMFKGSAITDHLLYDFSDMMTWLLILTALVATVAMAAPQSSSNGGQLVQPQWNWESVILSRNGPSSTTTPRPSTTWYTTTLRSFDTVEKIVGQGRGSVEPVTRNRGCVIGNFLFGLTPPRPIFEFTC